MGSVDVVDASMLGGTSETLGVAKRLSPAVSRAAAGIRKPQAGNSFHCSAVTAGVSHTGAADVAFGRWDGTMRGSRRQTTCQRSG